MFFLQEGGVSLGLVVEEEGERPGFVMNLPVTHIPFSVGAPLKCVHPHSVSFFGKRGVRLGLDVEGEDVRL
jgi:hypothetical protein